MSFTRRNLQEIREKTDLVDLVGAYTRLEQRGDRWWGLSPFKAEKTASFTVKPAEGFYYCFATQKGGDLFRFISEMEGLSFPEAVRFLAERAGISLEDEPEDPHDKDRAALFELYQRVSGTFSWFLRERAGAQALDYLREREVGEAAIETYKLGYAPDSPEWLYRFLRSKSYSAAFLERSGLFTRKNREYPLFRNRIIFPIADDRNRIVAFGARSLNREDRAKYMNSPDTLIYNKKRILYGLPQAMETMRAERRVYIAEGYMDVLALAQGGITNSVAPLGTALTEEQARLLKRWVDEVVLVFDSDEAGLAATFRASLVIESLNLGCRVIPLSSGMDPADAYKADGAAGIEKLRESSQPVFDYLLERSTEATDLRDSRARELLLRKLFPYIRVVRSEVRREALLEQVSDVVRVPVAAVRSDLKRWIGKGGAATATEDTEKIPERKNNRDFALVLACIQRGEFFEHLRNAISHDDLQDGTAKRLFLHGEDAYRHGEEFPRAVLDRLQDEDVRNGVLQRLTSGEYARWKVEDIDRAIRYIRIRKLEEKQHVLAGEIRLVETGDARKMRELLAQKIAIDQELSQLKARLDD